MSGEFQGDVDTLHDALAVIAFLSTKGSDESLVWVVEKAQKALLRYYGADPYTTPTHELARLISEGSHRFPLSPR